MTEIVKNNTNMAFDILETGNNNGNTSESKNFDSLFGNVDVSLDSKMQSEKLKNNEELNSFEI